jgi:hypothetical protein
MFTWSSLYLLAWAITQTLNSSNAWTYYLVTRLWDFSGVYWVIIAIKKTEANAIIPKVVLFIIGFSVDFI